MVVRLAFIGAGFIANTHLPRITAIEDAKIVAVSDIVFSRAKELAQKVKATAYSNAEDMLRKEKVDAVYVFTPPFVRDIIVSVAERGLPFFVEKPVALTLDEARRIERVVLQSGVVNSVGYMFRYFDTTDLAKRMLEDNQPIGLVEGWDHFPMRIKADCKDKDVFTVCPGHWLLSEMKSGAQIVESTTHLFDLARYLVGEVSSVYAKFGRQLITDEICDRLDVSATSLKFKNGAVGSITSTLAARKTDLSTSLKITAKNLVVQHMGHSGSLKIYDDVNIREIKASQDPFANEDKTFVHAVATGDGSKIKSSYSDGIETLKVTTAAVEAAKTKKPISL